MIAGKIKQAFRRFDTSIIRVCPCVPAALWLIAGILLPTLPVAAGFSWPAAGLAAFLTAAFAAVMTPGEYRLPTLFLPLGLLISSLHLYAPWSRPATELARANRRTTIQAVVVDAAYTADEVEWLTGKRGYSAGIQAVSSDTNGPWRRSAGRVHLQLPDRQAVAYGSRIVASGYFELPQSALVPGEFDYRRFLRGRSIKWVFRADQILRVEKPAGWRRLPGMLYRLREQAATRLIRHMDQDQPASLLLAMTLGYRQEIAPTTRRTFVNSGLIHLFAISGLHVGIIAVFILAIEKICRVPFRWRYWLLPLFLGGYTLMTGASTSAMRAWIMISLWSVAKACLIPLLPLNAVAAAAILILLFRPLQIIDLGFQFSFIIVTILITGWHAGMEAVSALREKELWIPRRSRSRCQRLSSLAVKYAGALLTGSLIAWLGSMGILLYTQGLFIPGALLINAMVALLAWAALFVSFLKIGLEIISPWLWPNEFCGFLLSRCMGLLQWLATIGSERPFSFPMVRPWLSLVVIYYLLLLLTLTGWRHRLAGRQRIMLGVMAPLLLLGVSAWRQTQMRPALAVFWGDRTETPVLALDADRRLPPVIVNAADYWTGHRIAAWVRSRGYNETDAIVLTGRRWEQSAGLEKLIEETRARTLVAPDDWQRARHLQVPIATLLRQGGKLRVFELRETFQTTQYLLRQPALRVRMERPAPGREKVEITRETTAGLIRIAYVHDQTRGGQVTFTDHRGQPRQWQIPFSRQPQWREENIRIY